MEKQYDATTALDPSGRQEQQTQQDTVQAGDINYQEFVDALPKEFRAEIEEALAALLSYIHSDEGTSQILDEIQNSEDDVAAQVGIAALKAMDMADEGHQWSDSAKVFAGYFGVKEVSNLAREAGLLDISGEEEDKIFEMAAQNYIHALITDKPTQEEREAEAIRIQKEVEPLMNAEQRKAGIAIAEREGIPLERKNGAEQQQGGLLG